MKKSLIPCLLSSLILFPLAVQAAAPLPGVNGWQLAQLYAPSEHQLQAEAKGRVMIYDGLTDKEVQRAMDEQFPRVEHMMFTRTVVTDETGTPAVDKESGEYLVEEDGCD